MQLFIKKGIILSVAKDQILQSKADNQVSTIFNALQISRPQKDAPITETDLENYVAEAAWKTFDKYRASSAKRLNVSELDLVLKSVIVTGVKIDGHRVLNPVGFRASKIEIGVLVAAVKKDFVCSGIDCFEKGTLNAHIVSETEKHDSLIYAEIGENETHVFARVPQKTSYIGSFGWGEKKILESISELFLADQAVAREIFERYLKNEVSETVMEKIDKCFYSELKDFINSLSDLTLKIAGVKKGVISNIFVSSSMLPLNVHKKAFMFNSKRVRITDVGLGSAIDQFLEEKGRLYGHLNDSLAKRIKWIKS